MKLFYIRWPAGAHTFALAANKLDLFDLLDESADPAECLLKELRGKRFAFDFMPVDLGENAGVEHKLFEDYESLRVLQSDCIDLPDEALLKGMQYFKGCFEAMYVGVSIQPEAEQNHA